MKKIFAIILVTTFFLDLFAQQTVQRVDEDKEIRVGQKIPDVPLGLVMNNTTGKKRFSDFKGKLIILDFWNTGCTGCIAAFPHMSELQKKFGDKIQIFLVNDYETQDQIEKNLKHLYKGKATADLLPSNLPSIVSLKSGDNLLSEFFPRKGGTGHHVWIDGNGIVRLRGPGKINTYEEKINDILAGKEITFITDEGANKYEYNFNTGRYNDDGALYSVLSKVNRPVVQYHSIVTRLIDEIASYYGVVRKNVTDSSAGTIRSSFLNLSIDKLYLHALFDNAFNEEWNSLINTHFTSELIVKDKQKYISQLPEEKTGRDKWARENLFSYEQICPINIDESVRRKYMLEDLNRYFGNSHGVEGRSENKKLNAWKIVIRDSDKLPVSKSIRISTAKIMENNKEFTLYKNYSLLDILRDIFRLNDELNQLADPVINSTKLTSRLDIKIPSKISSIAELKIALQPYGLDIVQEDVHINILVIKEHDVNR